LILLAILLFSVVGCAYFNTFANARQAFRKAEEAALDRNGNLSSAARRDYDQCVRKCQKLLDEYPESKWADDALFLMSRAFFNKKEYGRCLRRLNELRERFPEHPFQEEGLFMRGVCYLERDDESRAITELERLEEEFPKSDFLAEGIYRIAEAEFRLNNWEAAIEAYGRLLSRFKKSEWNDLSRMQRAKSWQKLGQTKEVLLETEALDEVGVDRGIVFEGQVLRVETLLEIGSLQEADSLLRDLEKVAENFQSRGPVLLLQSRVLEGEEDLEGAVTILENVITEFPRSLSSSEAWYRIGLIRQIREGRLEEAAEAFGKSMAETSGSIFGGLAASRKVALEEFIKARETMSDAEGDSSAAEARFRLAENQFLRLEDSESALQEYESLLRDFPDSPWAEKAAFARCYLYRYVFADTSAALEASEELLENYPDCEAVDWVKNWKQELSP
jgi:outer membrane protein assembly factor BamD (BamD/ComL family)